MSVVVREGEVAVLPAGSSQLLRRLSANQEAVLNEGEVAVRAADLDSRPAWRVRRLVLSNVPLRDVLAEMNRHLGRPMRLADPQAARTPVSGKWATESPDAFVSHLESRFQLRALDTDHEIVLLPEGSGGEEHTRH